MAELLGPGDERAVARDLVMLDRLRIRDDRGIENRLVVDFTGGLVRFLDQAVDRRAVRAVRLLAELREDLLQPLDLLVRLFQMLLEARRGRGWWPSRSSSAAPW